MPVRMHRTWTVALGCPLVLPFTQPSPLSWQALCTWYSAPRQGGGTDGSGPSDTLVSPGVPQVAVGCSMVAGGRRLCCSPSPGPSCLRCRVAWQATEASSQAQAAYTRGLFHRGKAGKPRSCPSSPRHSVLLPLAHLYQVHLPSSPRKRLSVARSSGLWSCQGTLLPSGIIKQKFLSTPSIFSPPF